MATDTTLNQLVLNKMTPEQYAEAKVAGTLRDTELYLVDDEGDAGFITSPATAKVGQTIRVSAVDDNGKPTAWEAVNMASGDGGASSVAWELVGEVTITEDNPVDMVSFTNLPNYRYFNVYVEDIYMETAGAGFGVMINRMQVSGLDGSDKATSAAYLELRDSWIGAYASSNYGGYHNRPLNAPNKRFGYATEPATNIDVGNPYYSVKIKSGKITIYGGR